MLYLGVDDDCLIKQVQEYFAGRIKQNGINKVRINVLELTQYFGCQYVSDPTFHFLYVCCVAF